MDINKLTIGEAREIATMFGGDHATVSHPYQVGKSYFLRSVTHHYTGRLLEVHDKELVIDQACWIADDGRFADALAKECFAEVEPFPPGPVIIGRGGILDMKEIGTLPGAQK